LLVLVIQNRWRGVGQGHRRKGQRSWIALKERQRQARRAPSSARMEADEWRGIKTRELAVEIWREMKSGGGDDVHPRLRIAILVM